MRLTLCLNKKRHGPGTAYDFRRCVLMSPQCSTVCILISDWKYIMGVSVFLDFLMQSSIFFKSLIIGRSARRITMCSLYKYASASLERWYTWHRYRSLVHADNHGCTMVNQRTTTCRILGKNTHPHIHFTTPSEENAQCIPSMRFHGCLFHIK